MMDTLGSIEAQFQKIRKKQDEEVGRDGTDQQLPQPQEQPIALAKGSLAIDSEQRPKTAVVSIGSKFRVTAGADTSFSGAGYSDCATPLQHSTCKPWQPACDACVLRLVAKLNSGFTGVVKCPLTGEESAASFCWSTSDSTSKQTAAEGFEYQTHQFIIAATLVVSVAVYLLCYEEFKIETTKVDIGTRKKNRSLAEQEHVGFASGGGGTADDFEV